MCKGLSPLRFNACLSQEALRASSFRILTWHQRVRAILSNCPAKCPHCHWASTAFFSISFLGLEWKRGEATCHSYRARQSRIQLPRSWETQTGHTKMISVRPMLSGLKWRGHDSAWTAQLGLRSDTWVDNRRRRPLWRAQKGGEGSRLRPRKAA